MQNQVSNLDKLTLSNDGDWHSIEVDMNKRPINPTDKLREIIGEGNVDGSNSHILAMAYSSLVYSSGEVRSTSSFIGCGASFG